MHLQNNVFVKFRRICYIQLKLLQVSIFPIQMRKIIITYKLFSSGKTNVISVPILKMVR